MESKEKKEQFHIEYSYLYSRDGRLSYEEYDGEDESDKIGAFMIIYKKGKEISRDAFIPNNCWVWVGGFENSHAAKQEAVRRRQTQHENE